MDHIHWWPAILAANNCRKLHSSQCWIRFRSTVHSTSHHSTTWWSDVWGKRQGLELRAELFIPPVKTVSPGGQVESFVRKEAGLRTLHQTLYSTSEYSTTWWSDGNCVRNEAELRAQDTRASVPPVNTVPHACRMESLWGERLGLGIRGKPVIPPVNTAQHDGQMESLWGKKRGFELRAEPSIPPVITVPPGGQTESFERKDAGLRALFHQSTQNHLVVRWKVLWGKKRGLELYSTSQHSITWRSGGKFCGERGGA